MAIPNNSAVANPVHLGGLYEELPLDASRREIRVLDLKASVTEDAPLQGTLRVVSLADSPEFTALSYVWGAPSATQQYQVETNNGQTLNLTRNCFQALKQLRASYGNLTIWVDALCVNQADITEKSVQVPLMGEIYTWAEKVYIWLGEGSEESDTAMDWIWLNSHRRQALAGLPLVSEAFSVRERITASVKLARSIFVAQFCYPADDISHPKTMGPLALVVSLVALMVKTWRWSRIRSLRSHVMALKLLSHPWFERSWTFQELILARYPVFLCGQRKLSWDVLVRAAEGLRFPEDNRDYVSAAKSSLRSRWEDPQYTALNEKLEELLALLSIWMEIPRPTIWNGNRRRHALYDGEDAVSALEYQRLLRTPGPFARWFQFIYITDRMVLVSLDALCTWTVPLILLKAVPFFAHGTPSVVVGIWLGLGAYAFLVSLGRSLLRSLRLFFIGRWLPRSTGLSHTSHVGRQATTAHRRGSKLPATRPAGVPATQYPINTRVQRKRPSKTADGVIRALRRRKASEPADRAHALGGIMASLGVRLITAVYSLDKNEVYFQLLVQLLRWNPELLVVIMDARAPTAGRPSWVPSWDQLPEEGWVDDTYFQTTKQPSRSSGRLHAARGSVAFAKVDGRSLAVRGYVFDRVKWASGEIHLASYADFREPFPSYSSPVLGLLRNLLEWTSLARLEATYDRLIVAAWKVFHIPWSGTPGQTSDGFKVFYGLLTRGASRLVGSSPEYAEDVAAALYGQVRASDQAMSALIEICRVIDKRRGIFFTRNGLLGTGTPLVRAGHDICLICGLPLPMVLQRDDTASKRKETYRVVSASFIEGAMHGEYFRRRVKELVLV